MNYVYLCLGSNVGSRETYIEKALVLIEANPHCTMLTRSSVYESEPWGVSDQRPYLNQVAAIETMLPPRELLAFCHHIESRLERQRVYNYAPRTVDIDILIYKDRVVKDADFQIPHRFLPERRFALIPLAEIASGITVPGTDLTVTQMLAQCPDSLGVWIWEGSIKQGVFQ